MFAVSVKYISSRVPPEKGFGPQPGKGPQARSDFFAHAPPRIQLRQGHPLHRLAEAPGEGDPHPRAGGPGKALISGACMRFPARKGEQSGRPMQ